MRLLLIYLILSTILLIGCRGAKNSTETTVDASEISQTKDEQVIAPDQEEAMKEVKEEIPFTGEGKEGNIVTGTAEVGGCSVEATIVSVISVEDAPKTGGVCAQSPCYALIRIDKIVKMGQLCGPFVVPGAELMAVFKFSLGNTADLFPDMQQHFPGLEINDKFAASFDASRDLSEYGYQIIIYDYTKTE